MEVFLVPEGSALFIMNLRQGIAFGPAAGLASAGDAAFDLAAALGLLIRSGAITSATIAGSIPS